MTIQKFYNTLPASIAISFMLMAVSLSCQTFEDAGQNFPGLGRCDLSWCDYDNDHDLDVLVTGRDAGGQRITALYRNDEGVFVESGNLFVSFEESCVSWGDYDKDGDQDLLLAGNSETGDLTCIYRNDTGNFTFIDPGLPAIQQGSVLWVDVDGDNDLDIFISGSWITALYLNDYGNFVDSGQDFGYFSGSAAAFGDCDNDGDFDLLINGDSGAGAVTKVFLNQDGNFTGSGFEFPGLMAGTCDWVDYDLDGDLDIAISGNNDALEANFYLYKNQGKNFEVVYAGIEGFALGAADWGDYDNDGDPDLILSGKATGCSAYASGIYRNDRDDIFYKIPDSFTTATRCAIELADYDNDGDLDFMISGFNTAEIPFTTLYRNTAGSNLFSYNTVPGIPDGLITDLYANNVTLSWSASSDDQSPAGSLTYNVKIGTTPGGNEILSSMALPENGYRLVTSEGNAGQVNSLILNDFPEGEYFWQVQAIDQAMEASEFSCLCSFSYYTIGIKADILEKKDISVFPNPASDQIFIRFEDDFSLKEVTITDLSGKVVTRNSSTGSLMKIDLGFINPGFYFITAKSNNCNSCSSFIKSF